MRGDSLAGSALVPGLLVLRATTTAAEFAEGVDETAISWTYDDQMGGGK